MQASWTIQSQLKFVSPKLILSRNVTLNPFVFQTTHVNTAFKRLYKDL